MGGLLRHVAFVNIMSQWEDPDFFVIREYYENLGHILKPLLPKFGSDLFDRLRNIVEKQVPARLKPMVEAHKT